MVNFGDWTNGQKEVLIHRVNYIVIINHIYIIIYIYGIPIVDVKCEISSMFDSDFGNIANLCKSQF